MEREEQSNVDDEISLRSDPRRKGVVRGERNPAPSRAISFERRRGPELFCLLDRNEPADTQGFVLAIRKDVLSRVDVVADDTIFSVREFFEELDVSLCSTEAGANWNDSE